VQEGFITLTFPTLGQYRQFCKYWPRPGWERSSISHQHGCFHQVSYPTCTPAHCSGIYYQNVRGIRTKQLELYENVSPTTHNTSLINLTEMWLNARCYYHMLSTGCYIVFRSDRASVNKRGAVEYPLLCSPQFAPVNAGTVLHTVLDSQTLAV
jgi:hypothetical protein